MCKASAFPLKSVTNAFSFNFACKSSISLITCPCDDKAFPSNADCNPKTLAIVWVWSNPALASRASCKPFILPTDKSVILFDITLLVDFT